MSYKLLNEDSYLVLGVSESHMFKDLHCVRKNKAVTADGLQPIR